MALFGEALRESVYSSQDTDMLVEGLLAKGSINMIFAADEVGKSILALQMALEAASGLPIFGHYQSKYPMKVVYIQTERPSKEAKNRIKLMEGMLDLRWENICVEAELQGFDVSKPLDRTEIVKKLSRVNQEFGPIDWVIIDPIYAWVGGDMVSGTDAGAINHLLRMIQKEACDTVTFTHHTNRGQKNKESNVREGEDMYGSRFLSANCSALWHVTRERALAKGAKFACKKDSWSCLVKEFELTYDKMTMTSWMDPDSAKMDSETKFLIGLRMLKAQNSTFYFEDLETVCKLSTAECRIQLRRQKERGVVTVVNPNQRKHLLRVTGTP